MRGALVIMSLVITSLVIASLVGCSTRQLRNFDHPPTVLTVAPFDSIVTENKVVIKMCVNWKGEVVSTEFQENQSTTGDTLLINSAIKAARAYKFEVAQGSAVQCGDMIFKFKLKKK